MEGWKAQWVRCGQPEAARGGTMLEQVQQTHAHAHSGSSVGCSGAAASSAVS